MGVVRSLGVAAASTTLLITVVAPAQVIAPRTTTTAPTRLPAPTLTADGGAPAVPTCPSGSALKVDNATGNVDECIAPAGTCPGSTLGGLCMSSGGFSSLCNDGFFFRATSGGAAECVATKGPTCPGNLLEVRHVIGADTCGPVTIKPPPKIDATTPLAKRLLPPPPPPTCSVGKVVVDMVGQKDDCEAVTNALCTQTVAGQCVSKTCPDGFIYVDPNGMFSGPFPSNTYCRAMLRCIDGAYVQAGKGPDVCIRR